MEKVLEAPRKAELPKYCPGRRDIDDGGHLMQESSIVGAHVLLKDDDDNLRFAIVPCCSSCNNTNNEFPLVYECTAVSIASLNKMNFVGKVCLLHSNDYFTKIESISTKDDTTASNSRIKRKPTTVLTIAGMSNKGRHVRCDYPDPDDYLLLVATLLRGKLTHRLRRLKREYASENSKTFKPAIIAVNSGVYPKSVGKKTYLEATYPTLGIEEQLHQKLKMTDEYILNPKTNRRVKRSGKIGKQLLKEKERRKKKEKN